MRILRGARTIVALLTSVFMLGLLPVPPASAQDAPPAKKQTKTKKKSTDRTPGRGEEGDEALRNAYTSESRWGFEMGKHPTINLGRWGTMSFRTKFQFDFRTYDPEQTTRKGCGVLGDSEGCLFELSKFRLSVKGLFLKSFDYEVEREVKEGFRQYYPNPIRDNALQESPIEPKDPWRDLYLNFHGLKSFQIQGGKFKVPFGLENLQGDSDKDFIYGARSSDQLTPGRAVGIMYHGRFFEHGLQYQAGLFKNDGDNAEYKLVLSPQTTVIGDFVPVFGLETSRVSGTRTFAGRLTGTPLGLLRLPAIFKTVQFGTAFTDSALPEGLKSLRGRDVSKFTWYEHIFVRGHRRRYSAEMDWTPGPFALRGEFIAVTEQRLKQGLLGNDLPDAIARGWYLIGAWMVTKERRTSFAPKSPFRYYLVKGGPGAVELAVRWEGIRYGSAEHPGLPRRSLRAPNILGNSDRAWTFGVNWYLNHWVKIQANFVREHIEDPPRRPVLDPITLSSGPDPTWSRVIRIQFAL